MSSILSAILGAGGPRPQNGPVPIQPGGQASGAAPSDNEGGAVASIQQMIAAGKRYLGQERDQEDLLTMHKILTQLQQLRAKDQQDADSALQGNVSPRLVRKAASGSSGGGGY